MDKLTTTNSGISRRKFVIGSARAAASLPAVAMATPARQADVSKSSKQKKGGDPMNTITTKDGTRIYYKDWGEGPVVTFSHGWPLSSDAWDGQMLFLAQKGFRVVAHDRRGHGRSGQASSGNDMDGYADDLAAVIEALDLRDATLVGHSTGGGEVVRYIARHGTKRVAKVVLIAAVPPIMLRSAANPEGLPIEVFDNLRSGITKDRSQFYKDLAIQFYGANRPGAKVSQGILDQFWLWSIPGKEVSMLTVVYPPGGSSPVHRHYAQAFVYVLEGSIVMQVKGGKEVTLTPGQTFYEGPDDVHVVDRNASTTRPAKMLVILVKDKGKPILVPVK